MRVFVLAFVAALAGGCTEPNPLFCERQGACQDESRPFCDIDGEYGGVSNRCVPSPFATCTASSECADESAPICGDSSSCRPCFNDDECRDKSPDLAICAEGECRAMTDTCEASRDCQVAESPICSDLGLCEPCSGEGGVGDDECLARNGEDARYCVSTGACGQCRSSEQCDAAAPVCDQTTFECRPCSANAECPSEVCILEGSAAGTCAEDSAVVYVEMGGAPMNCGEKANPCGAIDAALALVGDTRRYVRVRGAAEAYATGIEIASGPADALGMRIIGDERTTIGPGGVNSAVVRVTGAVRVTLESLTISGATGTDAHGVATLSPQASVTLLRSTVTNNVGRGVSASNGQTVVVRESSVTGNGDSGVVGTSDVDALVIDASVIDGNGGAGIDVTNTDLTVRNSVIANSSGSNLGGVSILENGAVNTYDLQFNTIVNNTGGPGVNCAVSNTAIILANNIVHDNQVEQVTANCSFTAPSIAGCPADGSNPLVDPMLGTDYRLLAGSPCIDKATAGDVPWDRDGDPRPAEAGQADVGADEFVAPAGP